MGLWAELLVLDTYYSRVSSALTRFLQLATSREWARRDYLAHRSPRTGKALKRSRDLTAEEIQALAARLRPWFQARYTRLKAAKEEAEKRLDAAIDAIDVATIPRGDMVEVGEWSDYNYSSQGLGACESARERAQAEVLAWKLLGIEAVMQVPGDPMAVCRAEARGDRYQPYVCKVLAPVALRGPLAQRVCNRRTLFYDWLVAIWDALPTCNVKAMFYADGIPNRWDPEAEAVRRLVTERRQAKEAVA